MDTLRRIRHCLPFAPGGEEGQTLVEYGLIVTLLAMAAVVILGLVGKDVVGLFTSVSSSFQNASSP